VISYVLRRLLEIVIVFIGITLLIYFLVYALPGDPIKALGGSRPLPETVVETLRAKYHLDEPFWQQYLRYLGGLFHGDFGVDFSDRSVGAQMASRWPVTIRLGLTAWVIEVVVGIGLGIVAALRKGRWPDRVVLLFTIAVTSIPVFVLGALAQLLLGVKWKLFPVAGISAGWPSAYFVPAVVLAVFGLAAVSRLVRTSMLENLSADYVRTARAKGMTGRRVLWVHVMRNSMIPAVTYLAVDLGYLLGGTVVIEGLFNLPGIGQMLFAAIRAHEGPTVVGVSTVLILIFLIANVLVDVLQGWLDPRVRSRV
jgi:oligopeptide transport system permease protein